MIATANQLKQHYVCRCTTTNATNRSAIANQLVALQSFAVVNYFSNLGGWGGGMHWLSLAINHPKEKRRITCFFIPWFTSAKSVRAIWAVTFHLFWRSLPCWWPTNWRWRTHTSRAKEVCVKHPLTDWFCILNKLARFSELPFAYQQNR
jgi:hypothetical protein